MFVTLEGKGILQTCTQEFMLASQYKAHDALSGECIRTFRHREFHGKYYLDRYDAMIQRATPMSIAMLLPRGGAHGVGVNLRVGEAQFTQTASSGRR